MTDPNASNTAPDPNASNPRRCQAKRSDGEPCQRWAVKGATVCPTHGGSIKRVKAAAARRSERAEAEAEWARSFGAPAADADPTETVLDEIRWCAGHVHWLRGKVAELAPNELVWGLERSTVRQPVAGDGEWTIDAVKVARPNIWLELYGEWTDRLVRMCAIAHKMGIEERHIALAERLGGLIAQTIRGVLDDLDLTASQREAAATAVPRHLRLVAGALNEGGIQA